LAPPAVLFLTYCRPPDIGGVERSVLHLMSDFTARGRPVTLVTHQPGAFRFRQDRVEGRALLRLDLPSQFPFSRLERWRLAAINAKNGALLSALCRRQGVALVHCHHLNVDAWYGRYLKRRRGLPFVVTLRGGELEWTADRPHRRAFVVQTLRDTTHVTALSHELIERACALVPEVAGKSTVIPNPVWPERLQATLQEGAEVSAPGRYVLFAGRLEPAKDVACLIDAYHAVVAQNASYPFDLVLVGPGSLATTLRAQGRAGPGGKRIRLLGACSWPESLRWIRQAAALVLPSLSSEGCPNVVLEAMALGTPVIVSNCPSLSELVADGRAGAVFPAGDARALAATLVSLEASPAAHAARAAEARQRLGQRHAPDAIAERYFSLYDALVAGHLPPSTPPRT
jgi:glycosyltransferase involved in cell wall biosynthesis